MGWYGVDLDGTLAEYNSEGIDQGIGKPIQPMVDRIKQWLKDGREVRIVTARAAVVGEGARVQQWLVDQAGLPALRVTNEKDFQMIELWDDRAVTVEFNTGLPMLSDLQLVQQRMSRKPKVRR